MLSDSYLSLEKVREDRGGEELLSWAVGDDAALAHEDDALDFRRNVVEMVGDEDEAGALMHEVAQTLAEVALGGEVEGVGGLVEEELAGTVDESAGDKDSALFAGGHFADRMSREMAGMDSFHGFGCAKSHFLSHDEVGPQGGGGEEAGDDSVEPRSPAGGAAGGVGSAGGGVKARVGVGDDSEVLAELSELPAAAAEDADLGTGMAGAGDERVEFAGHRADESGLAAAVRAENGDVFAGLNGEIDIVKDDPVAEGHVDTAHVQELVGGLDFGGGCPKLSGRSFRLEVLPRFGGHVIC